MKIALLSQSNVDEKTQTIHVEEIEQNSPDIYVEMTQEDTRNQPIMDPGFLDGFVTVHENQLLQATSFSGFNVKTKVFVKSGLRDKVNIMESGAVPLKKQTIFGKLNPMTTKGIVYTKLYIKDHQPVVFVNAHLPKSTLTHYTSREFDSYGKRKIATDMNEYGRNMQLFLKMLQDLHSSGVIDDYTTLILGGNLNFRVSDNTEAGGTNDLLSLFLRDEIILGNRPRIRELDFKSAKDKIYTCKFDKDNKDRVKSVKNLRTDKEFKECRNYPVHDKEFYQDKKAIEEDLTLKRWLDPPSVTNDQRFIANKCGKEEASRCDRFLVGPTHESLIDVIVHKGKYFPEIISDHNTLFAVIEYPDNKRGQYAAIKNKNNFLQNIREKIDKFESSVQQCKTNCIAAQENVCSSNKDEKCQEQLEQLKKMEEIEEFEYFSAMCKNNIIQDPKLKTLCVNSIDEQGIIANLLNLYKKDKINNKDSEEYKLVLEEEKRFEKMTKHDPESKTKRSTVKSMGGKKRKTNRKKRKTRRAR